MGKKLFPTSSRQSRFFAAMMLLFTAVFLALIIGLILTGIFYIDRSVMIDIITSVPFRKALWLTVWTSCAATAISLLFAIPVGFALSRIRFFGRMFADTLVDLPIVFPPLAAAVILLIFLTKTPPGKSVAGEMDIRFFFQPTGIIICQFIAAASFAIRSAKTAFDEVDIRAEQVSLTLGCSKWGSFRYVTLPLAANGIIAGGILTWARSFGLFGPLLILAGTFSGATEDLGTTKYLDRSIDDPQTAVAAALLMIFIALLSLLTIRSISESTVEKS